MCVDASSWQTYYSGIVGSSCGHSLDHCVQAVGLHASGNTPYWIVRNSWNTDVRAQPAPKPPFPTARTFRIHHSRGQPTGALRSQWGEEGYIMVKYGIDACGIAKDATIVTGAELI